MIVDNLGQPMLLACASVHEVTSPGGWTMLVLIFHCTSKSILPCAPLVMVLVWSFWKIVILKTCWKLFVVKYPGNMRFAIIPAFCITKGTRVISSWDYNEKQIFHTHLFYSHSILWTTPLAGWLMFAFLLSVKFNSLEDWCWVDLPLHNQKYFATCSPSHGSDMKLLKNSYFENMYAKSLHDKGSIRSFSAGDGVWDFVLQMLIATILWVPNAIRWSCHGQ